MLNLIRKFFKKDEVKGDIPLYAFVDKVIDRNQVVTGIKVKSGKFNGMVFTSNPSVSFMEKADGGLDMKFDYVIQVPPDDISSLDDSSGIQKSVGDIILDIIYKNLEKDDANRDVDFKRASEGPGLR